MGDSRAVVLRYEDRFTDEPATIHRLARILGGTLLGGTAARIFVDLRREAIEQFIDRLPLLPTVAYDHAKDDMYDRITHWHRHHAGRTGQVGRWPQRLIPAHVTIAEAELRPWIEQFGYRRASCHTINAGRVEADVMQ